MTLVLWVTVAVPKTQVAGLYNGRIDLQLEYGRDNAKENHANVVLSEASREADRAGIASIAWSLEVLNFSLPATPFLRNAVQLDVAHLHRSFPNSPENSTEDRYHQVPGMIPRK